MNSALRRFGIPSFLVIAAMAFALVVGFGVWATTGHADGQTVLTQPMPTGQSAPVFADGTDVNHEAMLYSGN